MAKTLMVLGTASEVGKSLVVTGLCRFFFRAGLRVAPFKAQNMSNNAYVCLDGGEIGWAQALQAKACGLEPCVDMNPVLLKPTSDLGSQVVVQGRVWGNFPFSYRDREGLKEKIRQSFTRLSQAYDLILLEGAGGAAEINLKEWDLANFAMAEMAHAPVILVGDIERGGVFASLVGTMELLEPGERERVRGFVVNKFRGERGLLEPGLRFLEKRTGRPVLGVLPYLGDLKLEAEDSVSLEAYRKKQPAFSPSTVNLAVVTLPHIANFTDFLPLAQVEGVTLNYVLQPEEAQGADVVLLPGSKNTIFDLRWLKQQGWPAKLRQMRDGGMGIVGVCGGYQMLGEEILDPYGSEGEKAREEGLGFLPLRTVLATEKTTRRVEVLWEANSKRGVFTGYEIHMGQTRVGRGVLPRFFLRPLGQRDWEADGALSREGNLWGTYVHGLFESGPFVQAWLTPMGSKKGVKIWVPWREWQGEREVQLDELAKVVGENLDMPALWSLVGMEGK